jgi:hypothetical protein
MDMMTPAAAGAGRGAVEGGLFDTQVDGGAAGSQQQQQQQQEPVNSYLRLWPLILTCLNVFKHVFILFICTTWTCWWLRVVCVQKQQQQQQQ